MRGARFHSERRRGACGPAGPAGIHVPRSRSGDWQARPEPMLKPRMPRSMQFFENAYPSSDERLLAGTDEFDDEVHQYYDLRNTERPVDAFSKQIAENAVDDGVLSGRCCRCRASGIPSGPLIRIIARFIIPHTKKAVRNHMNSFDSLFVFLRLSPAWLVPFLTRSGLHLPIRWHGPVARLRIMMRQMPFRRIHTGRPTVRPRAHASFDRRPAGPLPCRGT